MSENMPYKDPRNGEIDIIDLLVRMGRAFNKLVNALLKFFLISMVFLVKRWLPLGLSIIIGIVILLFSNSKSYYVYSSDLVIRNNTISNADMIQYINKLHDHCSAGNLQTLSNALKIPEEQVNQISDITAYWIIGQKKDGIPIYTDFDNNIVLPDTSNYRMQDRMAIRIIAKSNIDLTNIKNGIIYYINSDSLFSQRNRLRLQQNKDLLTRINIDIKHLDSLQKLTYFETTGNSNQQKPSQMIFLQEQKTQLLYNDILNLFSSKRDLETSLTIYNEIVTVLGDFTVPEPRSNSVSPFGLNPVILLFSITLFILVIIANRKKLLEIYNKY